MLRAKLEIVPQGEIERAETIATAYIFNLKTNKENVADYGVVIEHRNGFYECKQVEGWQRGLKIVDGGGAFNLLKIALSMPAGKFSPSLVSVVKGWKEENGID